MSRPRKLIVAAIAIALVGGYLLADYYSGLPAEASAAFVGGGSCVECHQDQASLFHQSHHDLAMAVADESSVLADFNDQSLTHFGVTSRMYRDGDRFMVQTEGPDGQLHDYEVKYTFGVEPLQQYMVEIEQPAETTAEVNHGVPAHEGDLGEAPKAIGRVQVLRLSWNTQENKWFYLQAPDVDEKLMPDDPLHWTGVTQNWNVSCAECHSTNLKKGFDVKANRFATTFTDIDVSCESCHGPGSLHLDIVANKGIFWDRHHGMGLTKLKSTSNIPQVETCAPCHSRRSVVADGFQAGCRFDDFYALQTIQTPIYHADGQIRDEDYVYGSFLQSKMFHKGIRCTDCHDPHSTKLKHEGNLVCTSCHQHPSGKYDSPSHHFHTPGTPGASCVNCHMPHTTYMEVDQRHDHSFRVPRPDLSVRLGTPNACTACHLDQAKLPDDKERAPLTQYLDWIIADERGDEAVGAELDRVNQAMLAAVKKWYPAQTSPPKTKYYEDLAIGLTESTEQPNRLTELATDATTPSLIRASAMLGTGPNKEAFDTALKTVNDSDERLVVASIRRLTGLLNNFRSRTAEAAAQVLPHLVHPSKQIRLEAVSFAMSLPPNLRDQLASAAQRQAFSSGLQEYETYLRLNQDQAAGQMLLGNFLAQVQKIDQAKRAYERAIEMNPRMAGPRSQLAQLLESQLGAAGYDSVALAKRVKTFRQEEHQLLQRDLKLSEGLPESHVLHYRFAMSCLLQKDYALAKKHLRICVDMAPNDENYLYAAALVLSKTKDTTQAKIYATRLLKRNPENPAYRQLTSELE